MVTHRSGCHCGRVRYEFEAEPELVVTECNCSVCTKSCYLGVTVPREGFRLLCGEGDLSEYTFKTRPAPPRGTGSAGTAASSPSTCPARIRTGSP